MDTLSSKMNKIKTDIKKMDDRVQRGDSHEILLEK